MKPAKTLALCCSVLAALVVVACGGGGGGGGGTGSPPPTGSTLSGATAGALSSGTISAFGSVFVNGHKFHTGNAVLIDDDDDSRSNDLSDLEVGMSVDVKASSRSRHDAPDADEIRLRKLVRGHVDVSDSSASTLTVLGQTVQLTASTNYSDHRACVDAAATPCSAVTGQSGLVATSGAGATQVAGSYVTVYGYLFNAGTPAANSHIVATLVRVDDTPSSTTGVNFKVEGVVTALASTGIGITIGGLDVDLGSAVCRTGRGSSSTAPCATAFAVGQLVSAHGAAPPSLPATSLVADKARLHTRLVVETPGAVVELEGKVSTVDTTAAHFVLRGIEVDASALPAGSTLPGVGDEVRVLGTVAADGLSVTASSVIVKHVARASTFGLEGDATGVVPGPVADTWVLSLLGKDVTVNASTRLADRSSRGHGPGHDSNSGRSGPMDSDNSGGSGKSGNSAFNITTFQSYLAASPSQHLQVRSRADASGNLVALAVTIVRASAVSSVSGVVDATPAPVISSTAGTPTTFSLAGLAVSADPAAIVMKRVTLAGAPLAAGHFVLVRGSYAAGILTVAAPPTPVKLNASNIVIDFGQPLNDDHDCF